MNRYSQDSPVFFGSRLVDPAMVRLVCGLSLAALFFFLALFRPQDSLTFGLGRWYRAVPVIEAVSAGELVGHLQEYNLWDLSDGSLVSPLLVERLPHDLSGLDTTTQKKVFLHTLLPVAMIAVAEVEEERLVLESILARLPALPARFVFDSEGGAQDLLAGLRENEIHFLRHLCRKYRTYDVETLRSRINPVPVSLIMAQGALESSWGGSRFAREGNNLFGIRTWSGNGMVPTAREEGKAHRVASYATLLEAVRSYILMLNRGEAYASLRRIRHGSMDSLALVNGLLHYSERREEYVAEVAALIRSNQLQRFDGFLLAGFAGARERENSWRLASLR